MKTIGAFLMGLIILGLIVSAIVTIGKVLVFMIMTMGEPECDKCESYDDGLEYCEYMLTCCDGKGKCNNFKRKKLWSSEF